LTIIAFYKTKVYTFDIYKAKI